MKQSHWFLIGTAAVAFGACTTTELGSLGHRSIAYSINERGDAVGVASLPDSGADRAVLFPASSSIVNLGTLPGHTRSEARAIADDGIIVGWSGNLDSEHAVLWDEARVIHDLGQLASLRTRATAINNHGLIVGVASHSTGEPSTVVTRAWVRLPGGIELQELPVPEGATNAEARDVNDAGLVVGDVLIGGARRAVQWDVASGTVLDITPAVAQSAQAFAINSLGRVAGHVKASDGSSQAVVWQPGSDVTILPGNTGCRGSSVPYQVNCSSLFANDINDRGVVVGYYQFIAGGLPEAYSRLQALRWSPVEAGGYVQQFYHSPYEPTNTVAFAVNETNTAVGVSTSTNTNSVSRAVRFAP